MKKQIIFLFLAIIMFQGCKKDPKVESQLPQSATSKLADNVIEVNTETNQRLEEVNSTQIVFSGNTSQLESIKTGTIIISEIAPNAPEGYLRKVTSIEKNGQEYIFTTDNVALTEAFEDLEIDYTHTFDETDSSGRRALGINVSIPDVVLYDADGNTSTKYDQIRFNGGLNLKPDIDVKIRIRKAKLEYTYLGGNMGMDVNLSTHFGGRLAGFQKKIKLYEQILTAFMIPGTPIVVTPTVSVILGADGSISAQLSYTQSSSGYAGAYLQYEEAQWSTTSKKDLQTETDFSGFAGNVAAKTYVAPAINIKFFGTDWAKGSIFTQAYASVTAQAAPYKPCELKVGVNGGAEANLEFFDKKFASASYPDIFDFSKLVYTCSSESLPVLTTGAITNITERSAISGGNISSDGGKGIATRGVCWSTSANPTIANSTTSSGTGTGNFTSTLTGLQPHTTYYVRAYATNNTGTTGYGNQVSFTTHSGTVVSKPTVQTASVTDITKNSATSGGIVTSDGGATVTARGIEWSTSQNFTTGINKISGGSGVGTFTTFVTGLQTNTTYYVRAYATNSAGTSYASNVQTFKTASGTVDNPYLNPNLTYGSITDIDGNVYATVRIGKQTWTAENLRVTRYNDGTSIPNIPNNNTWAALTTGAWSYYKNDESYNNIYGKLYNWFTVNTGKLCPKGWHVPTDDEWWELSDYLGGNSIAGGKIKSTGTSNDGTGLWASPNKAATNESGFTGLPGGSRHQGGNYQSLASFAYWWSSTEQGQNLAWARHVDYYYSSISRYIFEYKNQGFSCRCIKD